MKAFADDKTHVTEKLKFVLGGAENIMGKRENAGYHHFLLFTYCFQKLFHLGHLKVRIVWERVKQGINPFPNKPWFLCPQYKSFENTVEKKEEIACNKQFILFPQRFLPFWRTFCHFHQTSNCRLQILSVQKWLKFVL